MTMKVLTDTRRGVAIFDWGRGDEVINHESILFFILFFSFSFLQRQQLPLNVKLEIKSWFSCFGNLGSVGSSCIGAHLLAGRYW